MKDDSDSKKTEERKGKTPSDSWDALEALTREMREGGWDGYDYKEFRRRWGRRLFNQRDSG